MCVLANRFKLNPIKGCTVWYAALAGIISTLIVHNIAVAATPQHFVTIKSKPVNLRTGPGDYYPIDWIFTQAGQPLLVLTEHENWRKVTDFEGTTGWVHQNMVSPKRSLIVMQTTICYKQPRANSRALARLEPRLLLKLLKQEGEWCYVAVNKKIKGWVHAKFVWGANQPTN